MKNIKKVIHSHFELFFVALITFLISLAHLIVSSNLNTSLLFFVPVMLAGYSLGIRTSLYISGLSILIVIANTYAVMSGGENLATVFSTHDYYLLYWSPFLIFSGILTGKLYESLKQSKSKREALGNELEQTRHQLNKANKLVSRCHNTCDKRIADAERDRDIAQRVQRRTEEVLHQSMDPRVAKLILEEKLRTEKRHISVLVADLSGFTSYTERNQPEHVIHELNQFYDEMSKYILAYKGHIEKYTGDGLMLEFGAPIAEENHVLQSAICGWRMSEHMRQSNFPWTMRVGMTSGDAVLGLVGSHQLSYSAMGNCANTAFRLESICPAGSMLIDEESYNCIKDYFETRIFRVEQQEYDNTEQEIEQLELSIQESGYNTDFMLELGARYLKMEYAHKAESIYAQILQHEPENQQAKVGYAEANILMNNRGTALKGRSRKQVLYEVIGLKKLTNLGGIPLPIQKNYEAFIQELNVPSEHLWPGEICFGSLGHGSRVALLACALTDHLEDKFDISEKELQALLIAAHYHDTGLKNTANPAKQGEAVLKFEHLEESAYLMHEYGVDNALAIECVLDYASNETENPVIFHILLICDFYDTLTSSKPWRAPWKPTSALKEMGKEAEKKKINPEIFAVFSEMILENMSTQL